MNQSDKAGHWKSLVEQQQQSGLTIKVFCRQQQINAHTFQYWRKKFSVSSLPKEQPAFVPLNPCADHSADEASILLSGRIQLRVPIRSLGALLSQLKKDDWL